MHGSHDVKLTLELGSSLLARGSLAHPLSDEILYRLEGSAMIGLSMKEMSPVFWFILLVMSRSFSAILLAPQLILHTLPPREGYSPKP